MDTPTDSRGAPRAKSSRPGTPDPWLPLRHLGLTPRQCEVLWWIGQGKRDREIATILGLSHRTVHRHVGAILQILEVETRTGAIAKLCRLLINPQP